MMLGWDFSVHSPPCCLLLPRLLQPQLLNVFQLLPPLCVELVSPEVFLAPGSWLRRLPPCFHPAFASPSGGHKSPLLWLLPQPRGATLVPPPCPQSRKDALDARPPAPPNLKHKEGPKLGFGVSFGVQEAMGRCLPLMGAAPKGGSWRHLALGTLTWHTQQDEPDRSHPDSSEGGAARAGMQPGSGWG